MYTRGGDDAVASFHRALQDKSARVARYHDETIKAVLDIISSAGLSSTEQLNRTHIFRRVSQTSISRYAEIFPYLSPGCLLEAPYPEHFEHEMREASAERFRPDACIAHCEVGPNHIV